MTLQEMGKRAKETAFVLGQLSTPDKDRGLRAAAEALVAHADEIIAANETDMVNGREKGLSAGLLDRLMLNEERIAGLADGIMDIVKLDDPIGAVEDMKKRPNGLLIGRKRVPLGVVGMIYEARPNVTSDVFALCFKTGNAAILKGGSDAIHSNIAIVRVIREALAAEGLPEDALQLIESTDRETTTEFMRMRDYLDVLVPRGSARLIRHVVENSQVPAIETGSGNCHIFVDESADLESAVEIIFNAKTQRIGVCNACESLVVHEKVVGKLMPMLTAKLREKQVEIRADEAALEASEGASEVIPATEEDWGTEYLDYILSVRTVSGIDEAIEHINRYNTGHSEAIVTNDYANAQKFLDRIDAAAVYVNASTRFTDGGEFGLGAELGISTQKLHARGPMGLEALTTTKFIIYGSGQIR
ncbi:MAG: glutamate-5-semialdehyde dehydrogenase [Lachnospiraceae bacterium]|nr:glutamate-5-semialdehyde dehydrogenase [Lachnospiraceae bacterium]